MRPTRIVEGNLYSESTELNVISFKNTFAMTSRLGSEA